MNEQSAAIGGASAPNPQKLRVYFMDGTYKEWQKAMGFQYDSMFFYVKPAADKLLLYRVSEVDRVEVVEQPMERAMIQPAGAVDLEALKKMQAEAKKGK